MFDWLQNIADKLVYELLGMTEGTPLAEALNFFIYDSVKILLLLFLIIFLMGIVNSYFPVDRVRNYLSRKKLYGLEYLMASLFGVVTPFCSCSSVPLFIGFVRGGIPLGVTFSFLVTSPLVNEVAIGLFLGLFGIKITLVYILSGVLLGMISGVVLEKLKLQHLLTDWTKSILLQAKNEITEFEDNQRFIDRIPSISQEAFKIIRSVLPYVLIGIAVGGLMHGYIPAGFFESYLGKDNPFAVPVAVIVAVPMYANASGILPVVQVLVAKGIPLGTAIAFMMAVVGLSFPEAMLLKKVMSLKLIGIFFLVVSSCIVISGYVFNLIF